MKLRSICLAPFSVALLGALPPVAAHADPHPGPTMFLCPATISIGAIGDKASSGWESLSTTSAPFKKAEVIASVSLAPSELTCEYAQGPSDNGARVGRPEPAGMLCTVNTVKPSQFDCFPRPGAAPAPNPPAAH